MRASTCLALRIAIKTGRKLVSQFLIFRQGPGKQDANFEIHYGPERRRAGLLPLRRLVGILQAPVRRAGARSDGMSTEPLRLLPKVDEFTKGTHERHDNRP